MSATRIPHLFASLALILTLASPAFALDATQAVRRDVTPKSPPIVSVQTWATDLSDTQWQVNLRLMTADPRNATPVWVYPTADLAQVMVITLCRSNEGVTP